MACLGARNKNLGFRPITKSAFSPFECTFVAYTLQKQHTNAFLPPLSEDAGMVGRAATEKNKLNLHASFLHPLFHSFTNEAFH